MSTRWRHAFVTSLQRARSTLLAWRTGSRAERWRWRFWESCSFSPWRDRRDARPAESAQSPRRRTSSRVPPAWWRSRIASLPVGAAWRAAPSGPTGTSRLSRYDLVVLGTGPAGQKTAIAAAKLGRTVAVVERASDVGGGCIHAGTIPSKTLREVVSYLSGVRQRHIYGAAHRVKERITIQDLEFRIQRVLETEVTVVRDQFLRNYVGHV